jgi:hypothetical protein
VRVRFRRRETFDSGATPKMGEGAKAPATLADIDLTAVKARMAATIEKARAEDPQRNYGGSLPPPGLRSRA